VAVAALGLALPGAAQAESSNARASKHVVTHEAEAMNLNLRLVDLPAGYEVTSDFQVNSDGVCYRNVDHARGTPDFFFSPRTWSASSPSATAGGHPASAGPRRSRARCFASTTSWAPRRASAPETSWPVTCSTTSTRRVGASAHQPRHSATRRECGHGPAVCSLHGAPDRPSPSSRRLVTGPRPSSSPRCRPHPRPRPRADPAGSLLRRPCPYPHPRPRASSRCSSGPPSATRGASRRAS
jgi:hypothetical protein